jgi:hypothetical protein
LSKSCDFLLRLSEWLFFHSKNSTFKTYHKENKLHFDEMMMISALYETNTPSCWIFFIVHLLAKWNYSPLGHIILIPCQSVFILTSICRVLSREAANINFLVFGLIQPVLCKGIRNNNIIKCSSPEYCCPFMSTVPWTLCVQRSLDLGRWVVHLIRSLPICSTYFVHLKVLLHYYKITKKFSRENNKSKMICKIIIL